MYRDTRIKGQNQKDPIELKLIIERGRKSASKGLGCLELRSWSRQTFKHGIDMCGLLVRKEVNWKNS